MPEHCGCVDLHGLDAWAATVLEFPVLIDRHVITRAVP